MTRDQITGTNLAAYVSVPEAATLADLSERTIRRALAEDRLSGITVDGGRWMVSRTDLDRFARIARRRTAPSGTNGGADGAGTGTKNTAPSGTSPIPVPDGAVVLLASQIDALAEIMGALSSRVEVLEAALADAEMQLREAAPKRRWWHRFTGTSPVPGITSAAIMHGPE
ncbi:MAG: helix-turn-helix domain-containing protein [Miltoncostaeaceae bacterium]